MRLLSTIAFFLTPFAIAAQTNAGPRLTAMGGSGVALQDVWSLQANQAGAASLKRPVASIAYQSQYLNPDLSTKSAVLLVPYKQNTFGLSFQSYGFSVYNEQKAGFTYAKSMGGKLFASLTFNYHQIKIQQYGNAKAYSFEAGMQYALNENLLLGAHVSNPTQSKFSNQLNTVIPFVIEAGASYKFTDKVLLTTGVEKARDIGTDFKAGLEYKAVNWLAFRGGVSADPFRQYAGFGMMYKDFSLDAAVASHPSLGISPQLALSYEF